MEKKLISIIIIVISLVQSINAEDKLQKCFWLEDKYPPLLLAARYPIYNRCILIDEFE